MAEPENENLLIADVASLSAVFGDPAPAEPEAEAPPEPAPDSAYYSPSTGGFYHDRVHGSAMPADVIEIGHDAHAELMDAQGAGKMIVPGEGGVPVAVERPAPTLAQRIARTERIRDDILRDTAWRIAEDEPTRDAWIAYRAKVRIVDLGEPEWPDVPA